MSSSASAFVLDPLSRRRRRALAALGCLSPCLASAADVGRGLSPGIWVLLLPVAIAFGMALHTVLARTIKGFVSRLRPLAVSEPAIAGYERGVYDSMQWPMLLVAAVAMGSGGAIWYAAFTANTLLWIGAASLVLFAALLELALWQRVEVSADYVWFRRGVAGSAHQVAIDNIRDITVERKPVGFTLRRGIRSASVRIRMRMKDRYVVALPKSGDAEAVAALARHVEQRISARRAERAARPADPDRKIRRALRQLKRGQSAARVGAPATSAG